MFLRNKKNLKNPKKSSRKVLFVSVISFFVFLISLLVTSIILFVVHVNNNVVDLNVVNTYGYVNGVPTDDGVRTWFDGLNVDWDLVLFVIMVTILGIFALATIIVFIWLICVKVASRKRLTIEYDSVSNNQNASKKGENANGGEVVNG